MSPGASRWLCPTLLILIIVSYVLMYAAPGGPFDTERTLPPRSWPISDKYGLDQPLFVQIWRYVVSIVTEFDFGPSFQYTDQTVNDVIRQGFPVTLTYGAWAFLVAVVTGVSLGIAAALRHNSLLDYLSVGISVGAQVLPNFVLAPVLTLVFTLWLAWLPGGGWQGGHWPYVILPVIALSTSVHGLDRPHDPLVHAGGAERGLYPHGPGQGPADAPDRIPSRAQAHDAAVVSYLGPTFVGMITGSVVIDVFFATGESASSSSTRRSIATIR